MDIVEGYVEKIVYKNADNCYTVLSVSSDGDEITCVGTFQYINEGEYVVLEGHFKDKAFRSLPPTDEARKERCFR